MMLQKILMKIDRRIKKMRRKYEARKKRKDAKKQHKLFMQELSPARGFRCSPDLSAYRFGEATSTTAFDPDYVYHCAWAARKVCAIAPEEHIDISSSLFFVGVLSAAVPVKFYDFRPPELDLPNLDVGFADITALPFAANSVASISSLSVIEHIGLGRYGEPLDPDGDVKAMRELARVTKPGGAILINVPVARQGQVVFNAHRIYSPRQVIDLFPDCELKDFFVAFYSEAEGRIIAEDLKDELILPSVPGKYAGGCFHFEKLA